MNDHSASRRLDVLQEQAPHLIAPSAPSPGPGLEGTPWVSIEVERATERDRPYGWIVTSRTPGHLSCRPCMRWTDVAIVAASMLEEAVRRLVPTTLSRAEPLPPARRLEQ